MRAYPWRDLIQNLPIFTTGHDFLHSCRHLEGLHFSALTIAIRDFHQDHRPSWEPCRLTAARHADGSALAS